LSVFSLATAHCTLFTAFILTAFILTAFILAAFILAAFILAAFILAAFILASGSWILSFYEKQSSFLCGLCALGLRLRSLCIGVTFHLWLHSLA